MIQKIYDALCSECTRHLGSEGVQPQMVRDEIIIHTTLDRLIATLVMLRDHPNLLCQQLTDICGVDYPERAHRFDVVYHLLSLRHNFRVRVKTTTCEYQPVPTCVYLFNSADWYEREAFDMFGILFEGHPDLRRILTDYGFMGHPLRKDFPLTGYEEVRYDHQEKRVLYEPVNLPQEYRDFDFVSPWEAMTPEGPHLPGDEKSMKS